jgi:hypothetical protein
MNVCYTAYEEKAVSFFIKSIAEEQPKPQFKAPVEKEVRYGQTKTPHPSPVPVYFKGQIPHLCGKYLKFICMGRLTEGKT